MNKKRKIDWIWIIIIIGILFAVGLIISCIGDSIKFQQFCESKGGEYNDMMNCKFLVDGKIITKKIVTFKDKYYFEDNGE